MAEKQATFFVMVSHPNPKIRAVPMVDQNRNIRWFVSIEAAEEAAQKHSIANTYGYSVHGIY